MVGGKFQFKTWKDKNLHRLIYSLILTILIMVINYSNPELIKTVLAIVGVSFPAVGEMPESYSPALLGFAIGSFVFGLDKKIETVKEINKKEEN